MTSSSPRAVPWHAMLQFHREVMRLADEASFALPVTVPAKQRWGSLAGFEPGQLAGPWAMDLQALDSTHLQSQVRTELGEAYIGGPCWFRWRCEDERHRCLEWIPLIYRQVAVEAQGERLHIVPLQDGWDVCPLVFQFLAQRNIQTVAPLDEMLPELLSRAETKAAGNRHDLTRTLSEAFRLLAPELGEALRRARDDFPAERVEYVPSPWVLFRASAGRSAMTQHVLRDYARLLERLATSPQDIGGLVLLGDAPAGAVQQAPRVAPIIPLDDSQRCAFEAALAGRPVTVLDAPAGRAKNEVIVSILLNAWASSTSVLFAGNNEQTVEAVRQRLKSFESEFEIAVHAGERPFNNIDEALGGTLDLIMTRRGESHYGGSLSDRKHAQLHKNKQRLREMLDSQVPQQLSHAIEAALESHAAQREALSKLALQREELLGKLRSLGVDDAPNTFDERVADPLRKWRNEIAATNRLIQEDTQRSTTLQQELSTAREDRDVALAGCRIEPPSDDASSWLLAEPGFESFEQALTALSDKLRDPVEDGFTDAAWDDAYDEWPSAQAAADWERKARELAALIRPAGIALKEKAEEVRVAREALDAAQRSVQQATATSSLDIRREDLDEWASCYAELCALPRAKLAFLPQSRSTELVQRLEKVESRLRISFPVHLWTSIGSLSKNGRSRLSPVIDRVREWFDAREIWDRLSTVREEIQADTDALRRKLDNLGSRSLRDQVTPSACAAIASKLNEQATIAASAAQAWSRRDTREGLPAQLAELGAQIRAAGAGMPIKERWMKGAGAPLFAALDAVADNPGVATIMAVRSEILGSAAQDPILENWRRAHQAERERVAIAEEMERIPARAARLSRWKSRQPASLPTTLEVTGAFDDDDAHPVWAFLQRCEKWSQAWASYLNEDAPALEQTASSAAADAVRSIREAAQALPKSKERSWLEAFASGSAVNEPWPVDKLTELAALWRPDRLQAAIEKIDGQLERMTFESARERWLDRAAGDAEVPRSLAALRDHYRDNHQHIDESGYGHFEHALKAQPVWITPAMSAQSIPMQPRLFDLLIVDEGTRCALTSVLPLIFRAKRLVVIGDAQQSTSSECPGMEARRGLAARFGVEAWAKLLGHAGSNLYKTAVGVLPRGRARVISLIEHVNETAAMR